MHFTNVFVHLNTRNSAGQSITDDIYCYKNLTTHFRPIVHVSSWVYEMGMAQWRRNTDIASKDVDSTDKALKNLWTDFGETLLSDLVYDSHFMRFVNVDYVKTLHVAWMTETNSNRLRPSIAWHHGRGVVVDIRAEDNHGRTGYMVYRFFPYVQEVNGLIDLDIVVIKESIDPVV